MVGGISTAGKVAVIVGLVVLLVIALEYAQKGDNEMIDARGYSCPMPVVMVQNEVKKNAPDTLEVLVDSQTCVENVTRFGEKQGYTVSCASEGGDFRLTLRK